MSTSNLPDPVAPSTAVPTQPRRGFLAKLLAAAAGGALLARAPRAADAATEATSPFIGEIMLFAGNFAPVGWLPCNGQLLAISQYTALFSILGTFYGGNGTSNFALPNLQGRMAIGVGTGPGLTPRAQGEMAGEENHTLLTTEMPAHNPAAFGDANDGTSDSPSGMNPARTPAGVPQYGAGTGATLAATHIGATGGGLPHNNMPPYLALTYCIAINGVFPSRS